VEVGTQGSPNEYLTRIGALAVVATEEGVVRELSLGEVVSKTFELFRRDFVKYFVIFAVAEIVIGLGTLLANHLVQLPAVPTNPSDLSWVPGYLAASFELYLIIEGVTLIVLPIAEGASIKMAAEAIEGKPAALGASVRFALSKLVWLWALSLIVGVIVVLGFVALIVPGVILAIMLCLAIPALLLENVGVAGSLSRSRELVGHRWGKTFATFVVLGLIVLVISIVVGVVTALLGVVGPVVSGFLSASYEPILPIALTVYFFSNRARINPPSQTGQMPMASGPLPQPGMKFCPNCGSQLLVSATFCSNCGAKQPSQL
jgi:hypothetical protein